MSAAFRCVVFTGVFCIVYAAVYAPSIPTLLYYPKRGEFRFTLPAAVDGATPAMMWYGWVATAIIGALSIALLLPRRWAGTAWLTFSWIAPILLLIFVICHEWRRWFML
jgi:hypothetical protein